MKTVSVVMATYNGEKYLREQLDSIINQTYPIHEIIIQDDCSTDGTVAIIKEYIENYSFIKLYVNEHNLGFNQNFKTAVMRATGDFVALSDQDDVWFPEKIESQIKAIGNYDLCCSPHIVNDKEGNKLPAIWWDANIERLLFFSCVCGHNMLCRRDFVQNEKNWLDSIWYDWSLSLHAVLGKGIIQVEKPLLWFRSHENEVSTMAYAKEGAGIKRSAIYAYSQGIRLYLHWLKNKHRNEIYNYLYRATDQDRFQVAHRFCELLLRKDFVSIFQLCRLCQKYRHRIYFNQDVNGFVGWVRGFFFPFIYSSTSSPAVYYKDFNKTGVI